MDSSVLVPETGTVIDADSSSLEEVVPVGGGLPDGVNGVTAADSAGESASVTAVTDPAMVTQLHL